MYVGIHSKEYEEDFEEIDDSEDEKEPLHPEVEDEKEELTVQQRKEIEAIQRAMAEENERAGTAQSRQNVSREEEDRPKLSKGCVYFSVVLFFVLFLTKALLVTTFVS